MQMVPGFMIMIAFMAAASAQVCELSCPSGETCYATSDEGLQCLLSIPYSQVLSFQVLSYYCC